MPQRRRIFDAHHHLWDLGQCHYPWLQAKGVKRFFGDPAPIQRNYLASDLLEDATDFHLVGSVHIQVGATDEDSVKETRFVQSAAAEHANVGNAIVAFADLTRTDLEDVLNQHATAPNFRGVRQIVGRHPGEDAQTGSGLLLDDPAFEVGLKTLASRNLSFDLQLIEANYSGAADLLNRTPDLRFAICHFASPWDLSGDGFARWNFAMARFADHPGAAIKFSGFGMFKPDWTSEDIRPFVEAALELFGEERCMAGTNFPVDKLYGSYDRIWNALAEICGTDDLYRKITLDNAQHFYRVELPANR